MTFNEKEALRTFDQFMSIMDEQLNWLKEQALIYPIAPLEFNTTEFEDIEYLFDKMSENEDHEGVTSLILIFSRYIGEIVRRNYGGQWVLCLEEKIFILIHQSLSGIHQ
jgi:hypothetical protein